MSSSPSRASSPEVPKAVPPIYSFPTVAEFARRHKAGTEAEFDFADKAVHQANSKNHRLTAWAISKTRHTPKRSEYLFVVDCASELNARIPQPKETAKIRIELSDEGSYTTFWETKRVENPLKALGIKAPAASKIAAFIITIPNADADESVCPLVDTSTPIPRAISPDGNESSSSDSSSGNEFPLVLNNSNAIRVNFMLITSESTKDSELGALDLLHGRHANCSERQTHAFNWFVTLCNPEFFVNLHELLPHMRSTMEQPDWPESPLGKMFRSLNKHQQDAFLHGFEHLPCGIFVLPGGPGAGKTHFNLFTIAMAQLKPLPRQKKVQGTFQDRSAKVLFIVDMNSPVDDVANRMLRLYSDLGMKKRIIRMKGWAAEVKTSNKLNDAEDAATTDEAPQVDFTNSFIQIIKDMSQGIASKDQRTCKAPTLDEAAWLHYETYKETKYNELTQFIEQELWEEEQVIPIKFRNLVYGLYRDTLAATDFIATTPVAAHAHFRGMFKPDLVYFDEAPHARELCNAIAIANFDPMVWIFCGDHRQTVPYVGSGGPGSDNEFADQMKVSMMERAEKAGVIRHQLLINHRSYGGLHQLASVLWYKGKMTAGNEEDTNPLAQVRRYLGTLANGRTITVPRLLVHIKDCPKARLEGTSFWNPEHCTWVMNRVRELLSDPKFLHARRDEPGTILIISPYKKSFDMYKREIKTTLPAWAQKRVEARTVDVVQGHEADFVFLDLVKESSTEFLDNANRLNVAVTRARVGEMIIMHERMPTSRTFKRRAVHLNRMYTWCKEKETVVTVNQEASNADSVPLWPDRPTAIDYSDDDDDSIRVVVDGVPTFLAHQGASGGVPELLGSTTPEHAAAATSTPASTSTDDGRARLVCIPVSG
ncbi:P-loop containing nucleoside triphosphate hydrolase protein [Cladorrhinum sp. PSN332]|nr:P-loop containing nucleoside triphosphate hydrolase protein [Cladorrhinum sp. PSN332]